MLNKETLSVKVPSEYKTWLYLWAEENNVKVSDTIIFLIEYLMELDRKNLTI